MPIFTNFFLPINDHEWSFYLSPKEFPRTWTFLKSFLLTISPKHIFWIFYAKYWHRLLCISQSHILLHPSLITHHLTRKWKLKILQPNILVTTHGNFCHDDFILDSIWCCYESFQAFVLPYEYTNIKPWYVIVCFD